MRRLWIPALTFTLIAGCSDGDLAPTGPVTIENGLDDAKDAIGESLRFTDELLTGTDTLVGGRVVLRPGDDPWRYDAGTGQWIFEMHVQTLGATTFRIDLVHRWRFLAQGTAIPGGETARDDAVGADRVEFSAEIVLSEEQLDAGEIVSAVSETYETSLVIDDTGGPSGQETAHRVRGHGSLQLDFFRLEDGRPLEQSTPVDWTLDAVVPVAECPRGRIHGSADGFLFTITYDGTDTFRWTIADETGDLDDGDGFSGCAASPPSAPWLERLTGSSFFFLESTP